MEPWMQSLTEQIEKRVGKQMLSHYQAVIIPQIAADFYRMLNEAPAGRHVNEEYQMDDSSMTICLEGRRSGKHCEVVGAYVK